MAKALPTKDRILRSIAVDENGCWRWQLRLDRDGYGRIGILKNGKSNPALAHRVAYHCWKGEPNPQLTLDHLCRVRDCVNPDHLEQVSIAENIRRAWVTPDGPDRATHCRHGHEWTAATIYINGSGYRECRTCNRERCRRAYDQKSGRSRTQLDAVSAVTE